MPETHEQSGDAAQAPERGGLIRMLTHPRVLLPLVGALLIGGLWGSTAIYARVERAALERLAGESTREMLETYEAYVVRALREIDQTLKLVGYAHSSAPQSQTLAQLTEHGLLPPTAFFAVGIADLDGTIVDSAGELSASNVSDRDFFRAAQTLDDLHIDEPREVAPGGYDIFFSRPILDAHGRVAGVAFLSVDAGYFVSSYESGRLGEHGVLALLRSDGLELVWRQGRTLRAGTRLTQQSGTQVAGDDLGRYIAQERVHDFPVRVLVGLSRAEFLRDYENKLSVLRTGASLGTGFVLVLIYLLWILATQLERSRQREQRAQLAMMRQAQQQLTERRQLEGQLLLHQKLEAIGQLAAGIAHEINTPIQYVGDSLAYLKEAFSEVDGVQHAYQEALQRAQSGASHADVAAFVSEAEQHGDLAFHREEIPRAFARTQEGVDRVTRIVRAMKDFSHQGANEFSGADLNHAIESTIEVARGEYKHIATVERDLQPLPLVSCCVGEINQVLLNMIVNAAHAIRAAGKDVSSGRIRIATRAERAMVEIRIEDNGCGIPNEIVGRIYDPFFTTKEVGKGTGQGLAIAHRIVVQKHGGSIDVVSEVGQGTTFTVRLPIQRTEAQLRVQAA